MDGSVGDSDAERAGGSIGGLDFSVICDALQGSRKVLSSKSRGWSSVTQRQIIAMACVVALFDPEREDVARDADSRWPKPRDSGAGDRSPLYSHQKIVYFDENVSRILITRPP